MNRYRNRDGEEFNLCDRHEKDGYYEDAILTSKLKKVENTAPNEPCMVCQEEAQMP